MDFKKIEEYLLGLPKMEYRGVPDSYVLEDLSEAWTVCDGKFETGNRSLGDMYRIRQNNGYVSFEDFVLEVAEEINNNSDFHSWICGYIGRRVYGSHFYDDYRFTGEPTDEFGIDWLQLIDSSCIHPVQDEEGEEYGLENTKSKLNIEEIK